MTSDSRERDIGSLISLIDYRCSSAIRLASFFHSPREIARAFTRFCHPLILNGEDEFHPFGVHGSATFISLSGRYFAVITQHQLKNNELSTLGFRTNDQHYYSIGGRFFLSNGFGTETENYADELIFVDMEEHILNETLAPRNFFPLTPSNIMTVGDEIVFGAAYGFPHDVQRFDSDTTGENDYRLEHVTFVTREALVIYGGAGFDDTTCYWVPEKPFEFELAGMSGGPVFAVIKDKNEGFIAKLSGVTIMGSTRRINSVKIDSIRRYLLNILAGNASYRSIEN